MAESRKGRPRKGSLVYTKTKGWCARVPVTVDGERIKQWFELGTQSRPVARRKLERLLKQLDAGEAPTKEQAAADETFEELARRVHEQRTADGVKSVKDEWARIRDYALPDLAKLAVTAITTGQLNSVLDAYKAAGKSRQTVQHLKQDLLNVFHVAAREGAIALNPAERAELPRFPEAITKQRTVLTDEELVHYLGWQHPEDHWRTAVLERQVMSVVSRCFGGIRTGDLHALDWSALDTEDGRFERGWAPRRKTKTPQLLEIPTPFAPDPSGLVGAPWTPDRGVGVPVPPWGAREFGREGR